jgi:DNA-binding SARP family transcriptional activator
MAAGILASVGGSLPAARQAIEAVVRATKDTNYRHIYGVSLTNLAQLQRVQGEARQALESAREAVVALEASSAGIELVSARMAEAWALAHLGSLGEARLVMALAYLRATRPAEPAFESADIEVLYGEEERAQAWLQSVADHLGEDDDLGEQALLTRIGIDLRRGDIDAARSRLKAVSFGRLTTGPGIEARSLAVAAHVAAATGAEDAGVRLAQARSFAEHQGAYLWVQYIDALTSERVATSVPDLPQSEFGAALSMVAEWVLESVPPSPVMSAVVKEEIERRPERWRPALRRAIAHPDDGVRRRAALLLEEAGEPIDVAALRGVARTLRPPIPSLGRALARRLAPRVHVEDLGDIRIRVGDRLLEGTEIRRKVLALLAFLLTKPQLSASREEVVDALWPDLEPTSALNSLNQTVYFLRRVFEPNYSEDTSPGYVGQTTDKVWLDSELVACRSRRCWSLLKASERLAEPDHVLTLAGEYPGRFALDFLYDEWAAAYRDSLHAAFLRAVETSLRLDIESGNYARGISLAQLSLEADPTSDELQGYLVRLYRLADAHAAASEQYARYTATLREIGVDPPRLEDV